jgi:hypothetical protein
MKLSQKLVIGGSIILALAALSSYSEGEDIGEFSVLAVPIVLITIALLYAFRDRPAETAKQPEKDMDFPKNV